ncbi:hypothetical protein J6590_060195 [Homalodisca vitripennis]|nr:hypothetical protein J6590_060195 [Homalodisca vitripennis]
MRSKRRSELKFFWCTAAYKFCYSPSRSFYGYFRKGFLRPSHKPSLGRKYSFELASIRLHGKITSVSVCYLLLNFRQQICSKLWFPGLRFLRCPSLVVCENNLRALRVSHVKLTRSNKTPPSVGAVWSQLDQLSAACGDGCGDVRSVDTITIIVFGLLEIVFQMFRSIRQLPNHQAWNRAWMWLLNFKSPEGQVARWIERLQE